MALVRMGALANEARNSIGGGTWSRNKGGAYVRARVTPLNPRTAAQGAVRADFGANAKAWSGTLTADQRTAWTLFAQANPLVNVFGASIIVSGIAMYQKLNQVLKVIGVAPIADPPSDLSVPALAAALSFSVSVAGPNLTVETDAQVVVAGAKYYVFGTKNLPAGRQPTTSDYRFIGTFAAVAAAMEFDVEGPWQAVFGAPTLGANIGVLVATVNVATGALTPGLRFAALAGA